MRYYLYILLILIFSCEEIQENVDTLPYDFLISEGWINFEDGNFESSEDLFLEILDSDDTMVPYYSEAYLGLGWTKLYQAKELAENFTDNFNSIHDLRVDARDYFILILEENDRVITPLNQQIQRMKPTVGSLTLPHILFLVYPNTF